MTRVIPVLILVTSIDLFLLTSCTTSDKQVIPTSKPPPLPGLLISRQLPAPKPKVIVVPPAVYTNHLLYWIGDPTNYPFIVFDTSHQQFKTQYFDIFFSPNNTNWTLLCTTNKPLLRLDKTNTSGFFRYTTYYK